MNRLHTFLTAAACGAALPCGATLAMSPAAIPAEPGLFQRVQLGNGGPVGGGPNGHVNGAHSYGSAPSVLNPSGANGGAQPAGSGTTTSPTGGTGSAIGADSRPNGGAQGGNGSKPAPMQANGVRKIN